MLHDGVPDCLSEDDESGLACYQAGQMMNSSFCKNSCFRPNCTCANLYYQKPQGGCFPYSEKCSGFCLIEFQDELKTIPKTNLKYIYSENTMVLNKTYGNGVFYRKRKNETLFTDCTENELPSDENNMVDFVKGCTENDHMQCTYGCAGCYPIHKLCVFELNQKGDLMYCPSGAHLRNCQHFECNNMFKCKRYYYCIPYR